MLILSLEPHELTRSHRSPTITAWLAARLCSAPLTQCADMGGGSSQPALVSNRQLWGLPPDALLAIIGLSLG